MTASAISPRTVLEAFLSPTAEAALADIYDTANLAGLADQPVRLAIRRLVSRGDAVQTGRGRAGSLRLTNAGHRRLERDRQGLRLAFAQDAGDAPWDGHWRLLAITVPERERTIRDTVRRSLLELGAVAVSTGLYVSPHDLVPELPDAPRPSLTTATTSDLCVQGVVSPREIAEALWPSEPILAAYSRVEEHLLQDEVHPAGPATVRLLELADALDRALRHDPLLPPELRPAPWGPSGVRAAWADRWRVLSAETHSPLYAGWLPPISPS